MVTGVFRPIDLYVITSTFLRFFQNPKKRDFLRFFAVFHAFSRTIAYRPPKWIDDGQEDKEGVDTGDKQPPYCCHHN